MVLEFARVYKLVSSNGLVYYGSTTQRLLCNRLAQHKCMTLNNTPTSTSKILFADGAEVVITLVENVENCKDKYQLQARERWHIQNNECVNKYIPNRTSKEYYQDTKEEHKKYREEHKEEIKEYQKKYQEEHKEETKEYQKKYQQEHKEKLAEYRKEGREEHKEYQ